MRRCTGLLLLSLLAMSGAVASSAEKPIDKSKPAEKAEKTAPTDGASIYAGCELYAHHCASCHGKTGDGKGTAIYVLRERPTRLNDPEMWNDSDESILEVITDGNGEMPRYKKMLTEKQRLQIIAYVRTLAPKAVETAPAAKSGKE